MVVESPQTVTDPYEAAVNAHGAANPDAHLWPERHTAERFVIAFSHFEECQTRAGAKVETIVGRLRDGSWTREWLFPPEDPESRGWRAQQLEFIEGIRSELRPGDILVMELGAERPTLNNSDRKTRPFSASHHPAAAVGTRLASDGQTEAALADERDERDKAVGEADDGPPL